MIKTGERLIPDLFNISAIEHFHRYAFASQYVKDKIVVDIASGEGYGTSILSKNAELITGIDISLDAVNHAKEKYKNPNLSFIQGSADNIPISDNFADVVISFETIEHHDKHHEMINEIIRILKPNGLLIISSPDKHNYSIDPGFINPYHIKELYFEEFYELISKHFSNTLFLSQSVLLSSLIISEKNSSFYQFDGPIDDFSINNKLTKPMYHIAIASNHYIKPPFSSCYNGNDIYYKVLKENEEKIRDIYNSKTYKIGKLILMPITWIISILKRI